MLSIGNKKYRNLQEQVGFNTEQIEKIFGVLDGLNVQDNVVIISDLSTPLTAEELKIVSKEVAFIVYSGELYIKKSEDASNAYFDIVFTISVSGDVISFSSKEITVTLSNGALGLVSSTNNTYSKSHLDSAIGAKADTSYVNTQLALKANLSGADFTGNVTAKTLSQNEVEYELDLSFNNISSDLVVNNIYNKFKVINGVAYCIFTFSIENTSENDLPAYLLGSKQIVLPEKYSSRIYDINGNTVKDAIPASANIAFADVKISSTNYVQNSNFDRAYLSIYNFTLANNMVFNIGNSSSVTIPAGQKRLISCRIFLTLI